MAIEDDIRDAAQRRVETERRRDRRKHPVYTALRDALAGAHINDAEVERLQLSDADRARFDAATARLRELRAGHDHGVAEREFDDLAASVLDRLPPEQSRSDYLKRETVDDRGPKELAESVDQW